MKLQKIGSVTILVVMVLGTISFGQLENVYASRIEDGSVLVSGSGGGGVLQSGASDHETHEVNLYRRSDTMSAWQEYYSHEYSIWSRFWDYIDGFNHQCIYNDYVRHFDDEVPGWCIADVEVEFVPTTYEIYTPDMGKTGGILSYYIIVRTHIDSGDSFYYDKKDEGYIDQDIYPLRSENGFPLALSKVEIEQTINVGTDYIVIGNIKDEGSSLRIGRYDYSGIGYRGNHYLFASEGEVNYDNNYEKWHEDMKDAQATEGIIETVRNGLTLAGGALWGISNFLPPTGILTYPAAGLVGADFVSYILESKYEDDLSDYDWDIDANTNFGDKYMRALWEYSYTPPPPVDIVGSTHWIYGSIEVDDFESLSSIDFDVTVTVDITEAKSGGFIIGSDDETLTINLMKGDWIPPSGLPPPHLNVPTTITESSVALSWTDVGASSYDVVMSKKLNTIEEHGLGAEAIATETYITIGGLEPLTTYYFKVRVDDHESNIVSATTDQCGQEGDGNCDGNDNPPGTPGDPDKPGPPPDNCEGPGEGEPGGPPTGGCPYYCTWNGTAYVKDNSILPFSEDFYRSTEEITDYYKLNWMIVENNGTYSILLKEMENEYSNIDQISLMTVDHQNDTEVGVAQDGSLHIYNDLLPPVSAIDNMGREKVSAVNTTGGDNYLGTSGDTLTINFGSPNITDTAKLVFITDYKGPDDRMDIVALSVKGYPNLLGTIKLAFLDDSNDWIEVKELMPKEKWAEDVVDLSRNISQMNSTGLRIKLTWEGSHKIDYVGLSTSNITGDLDVQTYQPISANHSTSGDVLNKLLYNDDQYTQIKPGEKIEIEFPYTQQSAGYERDFVLVSKGYYWFTVYAVNTSQDVKISINVSGHNGTALKVLVLENREYPSYLHGVVANTSLTISSSGIQRNLTFRAYAERDYNVRLRFITDGFGSANVTLLFEFNNNSKMRNILFNASDDPALPTQEKTINITDDVHENLYENNITVYAESGDSINLELDNAPLKNHTFTWESIYWDFGDNSTLFTTTSRIVTHIYESPGNYLISSTVTYEDGTTITKTKDIIVT